MRDRPQEQPRDYEPPRVEDLPADETVETQPGVYTTITQGTP